MLDDTKLAFSTFKSRYFPLGTDAFDWFDDIFKP